MEKKEKKRKTGTWSSYEEQQQKTWSIKGWCFISLLIKHNSVGIYFRPESVHWLLAVTLLFTLSGSADAPEDEEAPAKIEKHDDPVIFILYFTQTEKASVLYLFSFVKFYFTVVRWRNLRTSVHWASVITNNRIFRRKTKSIYIIFPFEIETYRNTDDP